MSKTKQKRKNPHRIFGKQKIIRVREKTNVFSTTIIKKVVKCSLSLSLFHNIGQSSELRITDRKRVISEIKNITLVKLINSSAKNVLLLINKMAEL
jgi:hypothetical protein